MELDLSAIPNWGLHQLLLLAFAIIAAAWWKGANALDLSGGEWEVLAAIVTTGVAVAFALVVGAELWVVRG